MNLTLAQSQFLAAMAVPGNVLHVKHTPKGDTPRIMNGVGYHYPRPRMTTIGWAENNGLIKNDSTDTDAGSYYSITRKGRELYAATTKGSHVRA
jgi:predicted transcriptional regulator